MYKALEPTFLGGDWVWCSPDHSTKRLVPFSHFYEPASWNMDIEITNGLWDACMSHESEETAQLVLVFVFVGSSMFLTFEYHYSFTTKSFVIFSLVVVASRKTVPCLALQEPVQRCQL
ncbi:unnamed protein product [Fusarium venenatum]|uniref:Uncharacterized protein n=1 Tax=Fusarium venenatum TaxID=56646 RepID=A0A2L2TTN6_9HYPO|nr:uncharacterized protein FVRRES_01182 [Fusarium venenatum]CEI64670.1 unnamed protein product [Fusarium venenatum]